MSWQEDVVRRAIAEGPQKVKTDWMSKTIHRATINQAALRITTLPIVIYTRSETEPPYEPYLIVQKYDATGTETVDGEGNLGR